MNHTLRNILIGIGALILAVGIFFAGSMFARFSTFGLGGFGRNNSFGGMMSGDGYGPGGMMAGRGAGYGPGMLGGNGNASASAPPLTVDQAKTAAQKYLATLNNPDLKVSEVMVFSNNAYVVVKETDTWIGAFELLVDPVSQQAYPEFGANMMWNLKYGATTQQSMMGGRSGMRGWSSGGATPANVSADMPVSQDQAIKSAQAFLDQNVPGASAATDPVKFYGYYTLDFEKGGKVAGMLSVNGYNGLVLLHAWHAAFVQEAAIQ